MKFKMNKIIPFIFVGILMNSGMLFAQETLVTAITEDFAPLNYVDHGTLKGPSVEIVKKIEKKLGLTKKITVYPWKRGYEMIQENPDTMLFSTTRTKKREHEFKWVGPLAVKKYGFIAMRSKGIVISSLAGAKKYRVGAQSGGASEDFLRSNGFKKIDLTGKPEQNIKKLRAGRMSLWYTSSTTPILLAKELGIDPQQFEMVYVVKQSKLYIAFSKQTADSVIKAWQNAYNELYASGAIKKIFVNDGLTELFPSK